MAGPRPAYNPPTYDYHHQPHPSSYSGWTDNRYPASYKGPSSYKGPRGDSRSRRRDSRASYHRNNIVVANNSYVHDPSKLEYNNYRLYSSAGLDLEEQPADNLVSNNLIYTNRHSRGREQSWAARSSEEVYYDSSPGSFAQEIAAREANRRPAVDSESTRPPGLVKGSPENNITNFKAALKCQQKGSSEKNFNNNKGQKTKQNSSFSHDNTIINGHERYNGKEHMRPTTQRRRNENGSTNSSNTKGAAAVRYNYSNDKGSPTSMSRSSLGVSGSQNEFDHFLAQSLQAVVGTGGMGIINYSKPNSSAGVASRAAARSVIQALKVDPTATLFHLENIRGSKSASLPEDASNRYNKLYSYETCIIYSKFK